MPVSVCVSLKQSSGIGHKTFNLVCHVPTDIPEVLSIFQVHTAPALKRDPEQGHAQQADKSHDYRGNHDHQDIGTEQTLFDGHSHRPFLHLVS